LKGIAYMDAMRINKSFSFLSIRNRVH
jgi:hypothetical protein